MIRVMKLKLKQVARCDAGATLVEYGIAISLAVAVGIAGLTALGAAINGNMGEAEAHFD